MLRKIVMPKLGETMEEGTVQQWRVSVGDVVKKGDIIMDVETDKAVIEVEALVEGTVRQIVVEAGRTVPIGKVLAYVGDPQDPLPEEAPPSQAARPAGEAAAAPAAEPARPRGEVTISPRARRLAESLGIDIRQVRGSGPGGRIVSEDIEALRDRPRAEARAAQAEPGPPAGSRLVPHTLLRRRTAEKMVQSWTSIPCFELGVEARVDALVELRSQLNVSGEGRIAFHDLLIAAMARALRKFEILTGRWTPEGISIPAAFGIGLAVASPQGLVAPVIPDVGSMSLRQIAEASARLVAKARAGQLGPDDLAGGCTTLSNLGMLGIDHVRPVVLPGQGSILGAGRIREAAAVEGGAFVPCRVLSLTLTVDHRLTDGDYAARFLDAVRRLLERPEPLAP